MTRSELAALRRLARLHGVQTAFYDAAGRRQQIGEQALIAVLGALGSRLQSPRDLRDATRERRAALATRVVEPVIVAWEGHAASLDIRLPEREAGTTVSATLILESGEERAWTADLDPVDAVASDDIDGQRYISKSFAPLSGLPYGYHRLRVETTGGTHESLVIAAPMRAHTPGGRDWGVFLPLYALRTARNWATADFTDLAALLRWTADLGGGVVATLPLLSSFLHGGDGEPFEPSPYAPVSRRFWNELYIDVAASPELEGSPAAAEALDLVRREELEGLRQGDFVDYAAGMGAKRRVLEALSAAFFEDPGRRASDFKRFLDERPEAMDYAQFRAAGEWYGAPWRGWPSPARDGNLDEDDYDRGAMRYHLYSQWLADQQLGELARVSEQIGSRLYLDLPLGVHPDGYDVWRERFTFADGVSVGAPPDPFFTKGQDWGFPPLHPERAREQGHRYFIAALRHHLAHAGILRIDHVMGLHRLWWVPPGHGADDGAYVRYPEEEMYAILALESHRNQAAIVGEDLGTVPGAVRASMARHNIHRTYVAQFVMGPDTDATPGADAPVRSVASLNTHDMPTFASFWAGDDIDDRADLGLLSPREADAERRERERTRRAVSAALRAGGAGDRVMKGDARAIVAASLDSLARSRARTVLVNLEDLWLEPRPQNVPGTTDERPNWRRRAAYAFDEFASSDDVVEPLRNVERLRGGMKEGSR